MIPTRLRDDLLIMLLACWIELCLLQRDVHTWARRLGYRVHTAADLPRPTAGGVVPRWAQRRAERAQVMLRHWPWGGEGKCLRRSLVTAWLLRSLGPRVHVGAIVDGDAFRAHAWVEVRGLLLEPRLPEHVVLMTLVRTENAA